jgi:short-subunit dehydrogenase
MKKIILITGASSGMGKDAALALIKKGHTVYGAARRLEQMTDLQEAGGHAIKMDVTVDDDMQKAVNEIIVKEGRIDALINNAGFAVYGAVEDVDIEDARRQFEVNLFGLARLTQLLLPYMRKEKSGTIINISSMGGKMYTPLGAWYHATKHALEGWSDCLRLELKPHGINVAIIEPGVIKTAFGEVMHDPMVERSGEGPYAEMTESVAKATKRSYEKGNASEPAVISNLIIKAVEAKTPKTRYVAGKFAKPMMWVRKYMGDRVFDKIVMSQV